MKKAFSIFFSSLLVLSACASSSEQTEASLKIVTTISPLYSLTANLVEEVEGVKVTNIVPPNTSVHSYTLTPETAKQINEADLIIINGVELEEFLEDTLKSTNAVIVDTSEGITLKKFNEEEHDEDDHHEEDEHDEDEHHHGEYDPHIWLSPANAKIQASNIEKALSKIDEDNADKYTLNLKILQQRLDSLNQEAKEEISKLNVKPYVVFHDAYHYFEDQFDIHAVAFLEEFPGKEPTAEYLTEVIDIIEDNNVQVIFTEPQFSPKLVQTLSNDYNLNVEELDPLGQSVTQNAYFELIRSNIESFKKAFN